MGYNYTARKEESNTYFKADHNAYNFKEHFVNITTILSYRQFFLILRFWISVSGLVLHSAKQKTAFRFAVP